VRTAPEVVAAEAPAAARGGAERILLVEDEHVVRGLLRESLEAQGYQVVDADTPAAALELATRGEFELLLTDVVMPRMNGRELAERILQSSPGVRVLYISGYTREAINNRAGLEPGTAFLQKPFTMAALAAKVREVLDAEPARLPLAS
jgi:CheY-like chemotaxis protein